jgi:tRNA-dihydrouridine synthase B
MRTPTLRLGSLELQTPVLAAPIAGFTDRIFRDVVRSFGGCGLLFTEMVWAGGWVQGKIEPTRLQGVADEPRPLGVQLWDRDPEMIAEAARRLAALRVSVIDLNFGCPKKRIMGRHAAGATLLRDPATVGKLVAAAVKGAGGVPVTAKIRLGPSLDNRTAPDVARCVEDNGAAAITVHGRAADQHYGMPCHLDLIAEVVRAVSIPVIANGDIHDAASARRAIEVTGAAGVMVAREALNQPWIFREISAALRGAPVPAPPTPAEQKMMLLLHHAAMVEREGDRHGTVVMRKFACRYLAGNRGSRAFRDAVAHAEDSTHFHAIVDQYFPSS